MTRKFTCFPQTTYDVIILSNGELPQIQQKLELSNLIGDMIFMNSNLRCMNSLRDLIDYLKNFRDEKNEIQYDGKILFMFFNGLGFIKDTLSQLIDEYGRYAHPSLRSSHGRFNNVSHEIFHNAYFFFDATINPGNFNSMINIASDVIKKSKFLIGRIRGILIDDTDLPGTSIIELNRLISIFPNIELLQLTSNFYSSMDQLMVSK